MFRPSPTIQPNELQRVRSYRSARIRWKACAAVLLLIGACIAVAQPYVAGGDFGRPWEVARLPGSTFVAVAFDDERPLIYWSDRQGVWQRLAEPAATAELVVEGPGLRQVSAATVHGDPALLWVRRDLATGRTRHWLRWRGQDTLLLDALQPYEMALVEGPSGPAVLFARREGAQTVLRLLSWGGGDTVLHRSDQSLVRYRASFDDSGKGSVVWLEGFTDRNSMGFSSADWNAFMAEVDEEGLPHRHLELGPARYLGVESQTAVDRVDGTTRVLWPGPDGEVMFAVTARASDPGRIADDRVASGVAAAGAAAEDRAASSPAATNPAATNPAAVDRSVLGSGSPLAISDSTAYWIEGASIRSREIASGGDLSGGAVTNIAWSPATILRAQLEQVEGHRQLAWTGPTRGGEFLVLTSSDTVPFEPGLRDRTAAAMGWSPWGFWEGAFGQVMGALLAGMLVSMALSPLLWLAAAILVHSRLGDRPTRTGIMLGAMLLGGLLIVAEFVTRSMPIAHASLFGTVGQAIAALSLAGAVTWWWRRRSDTERLIGILGSSFLFAFVAVSTLAFLTFQAWLEAWSSLL